MRKKGEFMAENQNPTQELFRAIENGDVEQIARLVERGADVNAKGSGDFTPLHLAAQLGKTEVVDVLVQAGADVNATDITGRTPMEVAEMLGNSEVAHTLSTKTTTDENETEDSEGKEKASTKKDDEIKNAVFAQDAYEESIKAATPVQKSAVSTAVHAAVLAQSVAQIEKLVKSGANLNAKDKNGNAPIHLAAASSSAKVMKALIKAGANMNLQNKDGATALHIAVAQGKVDVVRALIQARADAKIKDKDGRTAVHMIAKNPNKSILGLLVKRGADVNARDNKGKRLIDYVNEALADKNLKPEQKKRLEEVKTYLEEKSRSDAQEKPQQTNPTQVSTEQVAAETQGKPQTGSATPEQTQGASRVLSNAGQRITEVTSPQPTIVQTGGRE